MKTLCIATAVSILLATTSVHVTQGLASTPRSLRADADHPTSLENHAGGRRVLNWKCVGTSLDPTQELHFNEEDEYNEYICTTEDPELIHWNMNDYRFGIYEGRVVLLNPDGNKIWGSDNQEKGTHIRMQRGGKLVLSGDDSKAVWSMKSGCTAENSRIEMKQTGVFIVDSDGNVKWYIDYDGNESDCDPIEPSELYPGTCGEVALGGDFGDPSCRMLAINTDSYNYEQVIMEVKRLDSGELQVTDINKFCWFCNDSWNANWSRLKPTTFNLTFSRTGSLLVDGGESSWSCREIVDGGEYRDYWTFLEIDGYECNSFGISLLNTMIYRYEDDDVWGCVSDC